MSDAAVELTPAVPARAGPAVSAHDITRDYGAGDTAVHALRGVSLDVARRRAAGRDGAVRLRKVDAHAYSRRARHADRGHRLDRRHGDQDAQRHRSDEAAAP